MENLHSSTNAVATMLFHLLVLSSLGTGAIVTKPVLPLTRKTDAAPAFITPAPIVAHQAIFARGNVATCGYVSGNAASPLTCPPSYMCTSTNLYSPAWGCCDQIQCQGNYNVCQDYGDNLCKNLPDDTCSSIYTSILKCSSAAPYCFYYARSRSVGDMSTELSLACGKASETVLALISTTGGHGSEAAATSAPGGISAQPSNTDVIQSTDRIGATQTSDSVQPTNNPSNTGGANPSNKGSKLSVGEIAGIVIPIVAIIVAVVIGWWKRHQVVWCCTCGMRGDRHSKRSTRLKPIPPKPQGVYEFVNNQPEYPSPPVYTAYYQNPGLHPPNFQRPAPPPTWNSFGR
ncbi:hypothetical protein MMC07_001350 [Pseudocyphellaria aurata]|nr:hypothetical protein [Pseudocyphellaria aurata]